MMLQGFHKQIISLLIDKKSFDNLYRSILNSIFKENIYSPISTPSENQTRFIRQHILLSMRPNRKSNSSNDLNFKVILIGESGTGKSCLMNRYVKRNFTSLYQTTIGTQFQSKTVQIDDDHTIKMQIWDTAGQESFRSIIRAFFRNANAILLVYDITKKITLEALAGWKALTKQSAPENALFILVGTHSDLQNNRQVSRAEAQVWMNEHQVDIFFETSSKADINVTTVFEQIGKRLFCRYMDRKRLIEVNVQIENLKLSEEVSKKQNECC